MRRIIVGIFLTIFLLTFSGCFSNQTQSANPIVDTYKQIAQQHIDNGDIESAIKVLEEGFSATKDPSIQSLLDQVNAMLSSQQTDTTSATTASTNPGATNTPSSSAVLDLSKYASSVTFWASEELSYENGGCVLGIYIDSSTGCATFSFDYIGSAPSSRWAEIDVQKNLSEITGNKVVLSFETDGWGHSGDLSLLFEETSISYTVSNVVCFTNDGPEWGVSNGQSGKLTSHTDPLQAISPPEGDASENNTPTYDTSKASGILTSLGMTEQEFRDGCLFLTEGRLSDDQFRQNYVTLEEIKAYPDKYMNMHFTVEANIYSVKSLIEGKKTDRSQISVTSKSSTNDGHNVYYSYVTTGTSWWEKDLASIAIVDYRDNQSSPNITSSDYFTPYLIFYGLQNDTPCFMLISADVRIQ